MKAAVVSVVTLMLTLLLNSSFSLGGNQLPPIGKFLHPVHGFWSSAEDFSPGQQQFEISSDFVQDRVQVVFDERLVPHIFAESESDLYYAQGYVTAKHRLFQMEIATRAAEGSLSEVLGERTIELDRQRRQQGIAWAAERAVQAWQKYPEYYKFVEAYAQGVNDYITSLSPHEYPLEYKFLGFAPCSWSPFKSALFSKYMAIDLAMAESDLENSNARRIFGEGVFDELLLENNPAQSPIIPAGTPWDFEPIPVDTLESAFNDRLYQKIHQKPAEGSLLGSNNWAVSGSKTASGDAIVCGDPHLYLTLPSIWYEVHLHSPEQNVYGVSLPGIPAVIIGFNEDVAWSQTNVGQDVLDWFEIDWTDANRTTYRLDGAEETADLRIEEIKVRSQESIIDTVRYTVWGPVTNSGDWKNLAMRWVAHDQPANCEVTTFVDLNKAKDFDDYRAALRTYFAPAQNFVFGSRSGDVAMTIGGHLPLRRPEQGKFVQDGSKSANAWSRYIPYEHNPYVLNPGRGFVSSANQQTTDTTYPYYYTAFPYFDNYRGRHLNASLTKMEGITMQDMMDLQFDSYSLRAADALPVYLDALGEAAQSESNEISEILSSWDFRYTPEAKAPFLFDVWHREIYRLTWDEFYHHSDSVPLSMPESWRLINLVTEEPSHRCFDLQGTALVEDAFDIVRMAFDSLPGRLHEFEYDLKEDNKGNTMTTTLTHIGRFPGFSKTLENVHGTSGTLNATGRVTGPSWRMVVRLGKEVTAQVVYPGGQSGNPGSPYYMNMVDHWHKGKYFDAQFVTKPEEIGVSPLALNINP